MNIVFLHPDLGIGGAERLVVDAALALKRKGHVVRMVTAHHDRGHCFPETRDGTLGVSVVGDWLPRSLFGRCFALCAYFRMIFAALFVVLFSGIKCEVIFVDQVSACVPFIKMFSRAKVVFYCHFPDLLLSGGRGSLAKSLYRAPLDWFEEVTTGMADKVVVNSHFTACVFKQTFKRIRAVPDVLCPSINTDQFDKAVEKLETDLARGDGRVHPIPVDEIVGSKYFLSLNRFERKKNVGLAIRAFAELESLVPSEWDHLKLVIAGGYDSRVSENVEHEEELMRLSRELLGADQSRRKVTFLRSPPEPTKVALVRTCVALVYTPENEHFGIVPLEAMYLGAPVIAMDSGGPRETVVDGVTGYLTPPGDVGAVAKAMADVLTDPHRHQMGARGKERVKARFSFESFAESLHSLVVNLVQES